MTSASNQELPPSAAIDAGGFEMRFADRPCPRCRSRFVASYYQEGAYLKSRCLDCMLFWPQPMMA